MTREDAIRILDGLKPNTAIGYGNETAYSIGQALTMAIKALEQNPCDDAISRQAVLEIFGYVMDYWKEHAIDVEPHEIKDALIEQYEFTAKQLNELPSVNQEPKWIPVSERLPDDEVEVLIYTTDKEINKAYRRIKEWTIDRMEWVVFETLGYGYIYDDDEVLAWMPLPKPYGPQERSE